MPVPSIRPPAKPRQVSDLWLWGFVSALLVLALAFTAWGFVAAIALGAALSALALGAPTLIRRLGHPADAAAGPWGEAR